MKLINSKRQPPNLQKLLTKAEFSNEVLESAKMKFEEHIRICGRSSSKIFPFLQIRSNDTILRRAYETNFQRDDKSKLDRPGQIKGMTQRFNVFLTTFNTTSPRDHHFLLLFYIVTQR